MQTVRDSNGGKHVARRRKLFGVVEGQDRLYPSATIDVLPDNVLLEAFEFYLDKDKADNYDFSHNYDGWQILVHVCRRWRCIVFASPRRLDLKLYCTGQRSVNSKALDIWPALPIVICATSTNSREDVTNVIAALRQHDRVCKIYYDNGQTQDSSWREFVAIDDPFPALTSLQLFSHARNVPALPDSFLGGSAPRLRSLHLAGIAYPSIGKLLSSTTNLVRLSLRIPRSGYISPETIIPCLSTLARLETLSLGFQYPRYVAHQTNRHPHPLTRVVFPSLTSLEFHGNIEYLEDILSQIETPVLNKSDFAFFNQLVFDTPLLGHFIRRTEAFMTIHTARVEFFSSDVGVALSGREEMDGSGGEALRLHISCKPLDWQLSALAQVLNSFLSFLPTLESLKIAVICEDWQGEIEVTQWQEFLHSFTSVKEMTLVREDSVRLIASALPGHSGERTTEVLPALQKLFLDTEDWRLSGPVKESIKHFIATRQLYGHPVTVDYRKSPPLQEGRMVAFHPPSSGKGADGTSLEDTTWIMAKIVKASHQDKYRYEVEDIEPEEDGRPLRYSASLRSSPISIIPLPDKDAAQGTPAHISSYQEFSTGATVMALYPDTTCFYRAEVVASPKDIPTNSALGAYYKLKFEDDDDHPDEHMVSAAEVVEWPGQ